jgi:hypothetical protein
MKTILYNTVTQQVILNCLNGYTVDGKPSPTYDKNIVELAVVETEVPEYNTETHSVGSDYVLDVEAKTYTQVWSITAKTPYEIAMEGWQHPEYAKRIVAPMELIMNDIGIKMYGWFQINGFPVVNKQPLVHLYCNVILAAHKSVIDSLHGYITIEDRPTE